ncbi:MAG: glycosyl hydrolase family 28-related protein [Pseudomonadota bacterium]
MPFNPDTGDIERDTSFTSLYAAGDPILRDHFDTAFNELVGSINAAFADKIATLEQTISDQNTALNEALNERLRFDTRAEFVTWAGGNSVDDGSEALVGGVTYSAKAGAAMIPDLPGWEPAGDVTVKHWGATGDGNTDDTSAINSALSWWASVDNGDLVFPDGGYVYSGQITVNLLGRSSEIRMEGRLLPSDTAQTFWTIQNAQELTVSLKSLGGGPVTGPAQLFRFEDIHILNLDAFVRDFRGEFFRFETCDHVIMRGSVYGGGADGEGLVVFGNHDGLGYLEDVTLESDAASWLLATLYTGGTPRVNWNGGRAWYWGDTAAVNQPIRLVDNVDGLNWRDHSDAAHPDVQSGAVYVGRIIFASSGTNPGTIFRGSTWVAEAPGRAIVGVGSAGGQNWNNGTILGSARHTLSWGEMPNHTHGVDPPNTGSGGPTEAHEHDTYHQTLGLTASPGALPVMVQHSGSGGFWIRSGGATRSWAHWTNIPNFSSGSAGSGSSHNNLQPSIGRFIWRCTAVSP